MNGVTVVIPSRTQSNITECLASILANERPHPRVIVVDDGIEFANAELRQFVVADAELVAGVKPFVFARNCNIGIHLAGDDDVIVMNDDALLKTPGGFSAMKIMADNHPEFGVISSSANNVGNQNMRPRSKHELREDDRMVCFVCVLIPRSTIRKVGDLDERFIFYGGDDNDYCLRVSNAGLKIGIYDGCFVDHESLTSTYRGNGHRDLEPNHEIFRKKWGVSYDGVKA